MFLMNFFDTFKLFDSEKGKIFRHYLGSLTNCSRQKISPFNQLEKA